MKLGLVVFKINLSDDFIVGDCDKCPLASINLKELSGTITKVVGCKLTFDEQVCPIEIINKENINND